MGSVVFDKKTFKVFYTDIQYRENKPRLPPAAIFFTNHDDLKNLGRRSPKEHFCQVIVKSV